LQIDDPLFAAPISANLFDSRQLDGPHLLFWSRADASEKG